MEAEPVSHMRSNNTGYLFPSFPWSWAWVWGNFKPNLKEERQLSIWRLRERAFQEVGRASPKGGGAWCFWGTARRSVCLGRSDICYTHYSKAHGKRKSEQDRLWLAQYQYVAKTRTQKLLFWTQALCFSQDAILCLLPDCLNIFSTCEVFFVKLTRHWESHLFRLHWMQHKVQTDSSYIYLTNCSNKRLFFLLHGHSFGWIYYFNGSILE